MNILYILLLIIILAIGLIIFRRKYSKKFAINQINSKEKNIFAKIFLGIFIFFVFFYFTNIGLHIYNNCEYDSFFSLNCNTPLSKNLNVINYILTIVTLIYIYAIYSIIYSEEKNLISSFLRKIKNNILEENSFINSVSLFLLLFFSISIFTIYPIIQILNYLEGIVLYNLFFVPVFLFLLLICIKLFSDSFKIVKESENKKIYIKSDSSDSIEMVDIDDNINNTLINIIKTSDNNNLYLSFALNGPWGIGKTTYLNNLKTKLESSEEYYIIELNFWQLKTPENVLNELEKEFNILFNKFFLSIDKNITSYFKIASGFINKKIEPLTNILLSHNNIDFENARKKFQEKINTTIKLSSYKKIIIIFDDLDRVTHKEDIYFYLKAIIYIINLNNIISINGINLEKSNIIIGDNNYSSNFFQKIFNVIIDIPTRNQSFKIINFIEINYINSNLIESFLVKHNFSEVDKEIIKTQLTFYLKRYGGEVFATFREVKLAFNDYFSKFLTIKNLRQNINVIDHISPIPMFIASLIKIIDLNIYIEFKNYVTTCFISHKAKYDIAKYFYNKIESIEKKLEENDKNKNFNSDSLYTEKERKYRRILNILSRINLRKSSMAIELPPSDLIEAQITTNNYDSFKYNLDNLSVIDFIMNTSIENTIFTVAEIDNSLSKIKNTISDINSIDENNFNLLQREIYLLFKNVKNTENIGNSIIDFVNKSRNTLLNFQYEKKIFSENIKLLSTIYIVLLKFAKENNIKKDFNYIRRILDINVIYINQQIEIIDEYFNLFDNFTDTDLWINPLLVICKVFHSYNFFYDINNVPDRDTTKLNLIDFNLVPYNFLNHFGFDQNNTFILDFNRIKTRANDIIAKLLTNLKGKINFNKFLLVLTIINNNIKALLIAKNRTVNNKHINYKIQINYDNVLKEIISNFFDLLIIYNENSQDIKSIDDIYKRQSLTLISDLLRTTYSYLLKEQNTVEIDMEYIHFYNIFLPNSNQKELVDFIRSMKEIDSHIILETIGVLIFNLSNNYNKYKNNIKKEYDINIYYSYLEEFLNYNPSLNDKRLLNFDGLQKTYIETLEILRTFNEKLKSNDNNSN